MNYEKYVNIELVGKTVYKCLDIKGVIVAFDGKSGIEVKFNDSPENTEKYDLSAFWTFNQEAFQKTEFETVLRTEDEELLEFIHRMVCVNTLQLLNIADKYIDAVLFKNEIYIFEGRKATAITAKKTPELYLKVKGMEQRKNTRIFGAFNIPTQYAEPSEEYLLLGTDMLIRHLAKRTGNIVSLPGYCWNIETGNTEKITQKIQLSKSGVWCLPKHW